MSEDIHHLIEQYLDGLLSAEEVKVFEERLKTDTQLATAFALRKDMNHFLKNKDKKEYLKKELEQIGGDFFLEDDANSKVIPLQKKRPIKWIAAVAATLLLILVVYWLYPRPTLYQQFAQHESLQLNEKSNNTPLLISDIETAFNHRNYTKALPGLNQYLISEPNDLQAQLAKGICLLEMNRKEEAKSIFEEMAEGNSTFRWEATWYLALTYVRKKNMETAKAVLKRIPETEAGVYKKASILLRALD